MEIRELRPHERPAWRELRTLLWPAIAGEGSAVSEREENEILESPERNAVLVADDGGRLVGFVEVALRDWAEGCRTRPVGYVEGWYVRPERRRAGVGRALIEAAERWTLSRGCTEIASDAELSNALSHRAHAALGFTEIERLVAFAKRLRE